MFSCNKEPENMKYMRFQQYYPDNLLILPILEFSSQWPKNVYCTFFANAKEHSTNAPSNNLTVWETKVTFFPS